MKNHVIIFALVVIAIVIFGAAAHPKSAKIKFEQNSHDFGQVQAGDIREFVFKFTNVGDAVLKIDKVEGT